MRATGLKTKREAVELRLRTLLRLQQQAEICGLRGKLGWEGDLEAMNTDRWALSTRACGSTSFAESRLLRPIGWTSGWGVEALAIGDLILAEVLQGFPRDRDFQRARRLLDSLYEVNLGGHDVAPQAAQYARTLRTRGITERKTIDTIIATRCIVDDLVL